MLPLYAHHEEGSKVVSYLQGDEYVFADEIIEKQARL